LSEQDEGEPDAEVVDAEVVEVSGPVDRLNLYDELPPVPEVLSGVDVIVGGLWDNRPKDVWRPEDGFAPTAYIRNGSIRNKMQCCAKKVRSQGGGRCTQHVEVNSLGEAIKRNCYYHGGRREIPIVNGRRGLRYISKARQGNSKSRAAFAEKVSAMLSDPRIADNAENVALIDANIEKLLDRMDDSDSPHFRREAVKLFEKVGSAEDDAGMDQALEALGDHLKDGWSQDKLLLEVHTLSERRARIVDRQRSLDLKENETFSRTIVVSALDKILTLISAQLPENYAVPLIDSITRELVAAEGASGPVTLPPGPA